MHAIVSHAGDGRRLPFRLFISLTRQGNPACLGSTLTLSPLLLLLLTTFPLAMAMEPAP